MLPRALFQCTRAFYRWVVVLVFFALLLGWSSALLYRGKCPEPAPSRPPLMHLRLHGLSNFARFTTTAYAIGDGFTPGILAADGKLVSVGTLAVSPDLKATLWGRRLCLRPTPTWLPRGCGIVRDVMAPELRKTIDVFAPSIHDAISWGRRVVVGEW